MFDLKQRYAIGITINGNEVRAAFLSLVRNKARIKALESTKLMAPLDRSRIIEKTKLASINDLENAFDMNDPEFMEEEHHEIEEKSEQEQNVSQIYSLLDKFQNMKANLAINSPILTVRYDYLDKEAVPKKKKFNFNLFSLKGKIDIWNNNNNGEELRRTKYIDMADGKILQIDYEYNPPIIDLMDEVNQFRAGNLNLTLMDTNELALVDLVNEIYKLQKDEITAIIYIEQDFSRVIFLKGRDIYHVTPIVHKGSESKDVLEVVYSKMIFAQDHHFIPEISKILVAGHSSRIKAKYYFRQKFPSAITGYLNSKKIQSDLRFKDRGLLFSRYAVPIALAWKALQKNTTSSRKRNLLPEYIQERQTMPKLSINGFLLLFLLAMTAFSFTWLVVKKNMQVNQVSQTIGRMQAQVENNKSLTEKVKSFDNQINEIDKKVALVDSFSEGYEETINFLQTLNRSIEKTGDIWITELRKTGKKIAINGIAKRRDRIPVLANTLGRANLNKVTRSQYMNTDVFTFHMETELDEQSNAKDVDIFSLFSNKNNGARETGTDNHKATNSSNGTAKK